MNPHAHLQPQLLQKKPCRARRQILLRIAQRRVRARKLHALRNQLNLQRVPQRDRRHQRFQLVKAIRPLAQDMEIEIDLGRSELFHCVMLC